MRRVLLAVFSMVLAGLTGNCIGAGQALVAQDMAVLVEVSSDNGAITRVVDKTTGSTLAPENAPPENFRLVLVKPDKTTVTILGKDQKLSEHTGEPGSLTLVWDGPLKDTAGAEHSIRIQMDVRVRDGAAEFTLGLQNNTELKMREAWYPLIGGVQKLAPDASAWVPLFHAWEKPLQAPLGDNMLGYPGQMSMSFLSVQSKSTGRSIYFSSQDEIARYKGYHLMGVSGEKGEDAFVCIHHSPFTPPGGSFSGSPVVLRFVDGDWRAAGKCYREWFKGAFGIADPKTDWIRKESFFLIAMFLLPEGTINYTFKDIPRWAKAAKEYGVNAVQISGWQMGGHDNGYPYYVPDPRLGTWDDLKAGIRACHKMGLKVFFFVNYQQVMLDSDWYKNELYKYREFNADGGLTWNIGWGMGTLWARMGHPKLMTVVDLGFPRYRKVIVDQFEQLAKIGADGVHVDKMGPSGIDYNPDLPMSPDTSALEGSIMLTKEVMAACRKHNPNWAMSFESGWDRMIQFGRSTWWVGYQPLTRQVFPENAETINIGNPSYALVNEHVRRGNHVMIAPRYYTRGMEWAPFRNTALYIRDVKRIQDKLQETVFLGEVMGHEGAKLRDQQAKGVEYNVFRNLRTGLRACILTNSTPEPCTQAIEGFDGSSSGWARVHVPSRKSYEAKLPADIQIPPLGIVFVEEMAKTGRVTSTPAASEPGGIPWQTLNARSAGDESVTYKRLTPDPGRSITLEDSSILIEVDRADGSVTRILDKKTGLDLILEPRLAESFRFSLPLPGKEPWQTIEANWIIGSQQKLSSFNIDGAKLTLRWNGPLANYLGEKYDVSVTETIELVDGGALFNLIVGNRSPYQVGETYFPILGGVQGLGKTRGQLKETEFVRPVKDGSCAPATIFHKFTEMTDFLGDHGPEQFYAYPDTQPEPWIAFRASKLGRCVYVGAHDPSDRKKVVHLELIPACTAAPTEADGNWPRPGEFGTEPVGVALSFVDCIGGAPGKSYEAAPVFVRFHDGDWHESRKLYEASRGGQK